RQAWTKVESASTATKGLAGSSPPGSSPSRKKRWRKATAFRRSSLPTVRVPQKKRNYCSSRPRGRVD
ncbi:MAG TPA: hypothetical protein VKX17_24230, partial [Planctomycetota bacterium]|nr:hypothetical protein [Planctomycetota bacterium]